MLQRAVIATSLTWRVFGWTATIVAIVVSVAFLMASTTAARTTTAAASRDLEQAADLVAQLLAGRERSLAGGARVFVQGPYFRTLVAERRRSDMLDQSVEAAQQLDARWVFITDGTGTLLAKSDDPAAAGDQLGGVPLVAAALRGQPSGGFGVSGDSLLFQAVAVPIALPAAAPLGALVATIAIDSAVLANIRSATASHVVFFSRDPAGVAKVLQSTLPSSGAMLRALDPILRQSNTRSLDVPRFVAASVEINEVGYLAQTASLTTAGGDVIGGFVVLRPRDTMLAALVGVRRSLLVAGVVGLLLALLATWGAARHVVQPVRALALALRDAADGRYAAPTTSANTVITDGGDIGALARAFDALVLDLRDKDSLSATTAAIGGVRARATREEEQRVVGTSARAALSLRGRTTRTAGLPLAAGDLLARRYHITSVVGTGGSGVVFQAQDRVLGEIVAIKVLRPDVAALVGTEGSTLREELRMARRVTHRNVVRMHDLGDSEHGAFLTMEYVEGMALDAVIRSRGALPVAAVLSLARQLLRALREAHAQHIVHGDIKPQNLLVSPNGVLKVTDFGLARVVREAQRTAPPADAREPQLRGAIIGTPEYLAPELLIGGRPSVPSDLYAVGVVLHECLVGRTPSDADTPMAFLARKLGEPGERAPRSTAVMAADERAARKVPVALDECVSRLTSADPNERPRSADLVLTLLARMR
ncbi:MAG: protein kinase [Gemmatimonadaceae bacterium]|nr:protein kinase [Gemmatimonadaceae bacterium]